MLKLITTLSSDELFIPTEAEDTQEKVTNLLRLVLSGNILIKFSPSFTRRYSLSGN